VHNLCDLRRTSHRNLQTEFLKNRSEILGEDPRFIGLSQACWVEGDLALVEPARQLDEIVSGNCNSLVVEAIRRVGGHVVTGPLAAGKEEEGSAVFPEDLVIAHVTHVVIAQPSNIQAIFFGQVLDRGADQPLRALFRQVLGSHQEKAVFQTRQLDIVPHQVHNNRAAEIFLALAVIE